MNVAFPPVGVAPDKGAGTEFIGIDCAAVMVLPVIEDFTSIKITFEVLEHPPDITVLLNQALCASGVAGV